LAETAPLRQVLEPFGRQALTRAARDVDDAKTVPLPLAACRAAQRAMAAAETVIHYACKVTLNLL
jgi:hypothetical protein